MLIPDNIEEFTSLGEKVLYLRFKNDKSTEEMYILHSLFTNHHIKNISGELDFLVLAPNKGIFAIEVKHGKVSRKDGTWFYENRFNDVTTKKTSPFSQVNGTMNSIRNYILKAVEGDKTLYDRYYKIIWGSGVAFTSMNEFLDFGPEAHSWQILTRQGLRYPISYYIDALSTGAHNQNKAKYWYDVNLSRPTKKDCLSILRILRGDFSVDYLEINKINDNQYLIEEFTKEQFGLLDFVNYNKRCLIKGDAGTGKTLMAIELLRRGIEKGLRVGLFCYNNMLGQKLFDQVQNISKDKKGSYYAGTLHKFLLNSVDVTIPEEQEGKKSNFFSETLPFEFLLQNEVVGEEDKFDLLILDEAQDLISPYYIEVFNLILKGKLNKGAWVFLGDFSKQAIFLNKPDDSLNLLREISNFTTFPPLKINCRNTKNIALQNTLLTGAEKPAFPSKSIEGDIIVNKFPSTNSQQKVIEEILEELKSKKIPLDKITLLSNKKIENTLLGSSSYVAELIKEGLKVYTIQSYKGLENTVVILFDFKDICSIESQRLLYVGISRARQKLFIVMRKSLQNDYQKLVQDNYKKLT